MEVDDLASGVEVGAMFFLWRKILSGKGGRRRVIVVREGYVEAPAMADAQETVRRRGCLILHHRKKLRRARVNPRFSLGLERAEVAKLFHVYICTSHSKFSV